MDRAATVGYFVFFGGVHGGVDVRLAVGDETGGERNAVGNRGLWLEEESAWAGSTENMRHRFAWKLKGGGADEGRAVKFLWVLGEFGEEVPEPLLVGGIGACAPSSCGEAEFSRESGNLYTGVLGEGGEAMRLIVVKITFDDRVFFVTVPCFFRLSHHSQTVGRYEFDRKRVQNLADFF